MCVVKGTTMNATRLLLPQSASLRLQPGSATWDLRLADGQAYRPVRTIATFVTPLSRPSQENVSGLRMDDIISGQGALRVDEFEANGAALFLTLKYDEPKHGVTHTLLVDLVAAPP